MQKYDRKAILNQAWACARAAAHKFGGSPKSYISAAMAQAWAEAKASAKPAEITEAQASMEFGAKEITVKVTKGKLWQNGAGIKRTYFDVEVFGKANPINKFYEIHEGGSRGIILNIKGRFFAYEYGFCNSKTKRDAVDDLVSDLVNQLTANG